MLWEEALLALCLVCDDVTLTEGEILEQRMALHEMNDICPPSYQPHMDTSGPDMLVIDTELEASDDGEDATPMVHEADIIGDRAMEIGIASYLIDRARAIDIV